MSELGGAEQASHTARSGAPGRRCRRAVRRCSDDRILGSSQAGGRGTHRLLTDCPAAEEGAAAALLPPVVGDPIAVWLILPFEEQKEELP